MVIWFLIGGVTSMDPFLEKFFPSVLRKKRDSATTNQYCQYDSQTLTMFTSSLYLAALISSLVASTVTRKFGRKLSMLFGGVLFCSGAIINGSAKNILMLIIGRVFLGFGIGFTNQVYKPLLLWILLFILSEFRFCFGQRILLFFFSFFFWFYTSCPQGT